MSIKQAPPFLLGATEYDKSLAYNQWCRELPVTSGLNTFVTDMSGDFFPPDGAPLKKSIFTPNGTDNYMLTGINCRNIKRIRIYEKFNSTLSDTCGARNATWADPVEDQYYLTLGTVSNVDRIFLTHGKNTPTYTALSYNLVNGAWYLTDIQFNGINSITATTYNKDSSRFGFVTFAYDPLSLPDLEFSLLATRYKRARYSTDVHYAHSTRAVQWFEITDTSDVVHRWEFDAGAGAYIRKVVAQDLYYKVEGTVTTAWTTDNSFTNSINATGFSIASGIEKLVYYNASNATSTLQVAPTGLIAPIGYGETIKSTLKSGTVVPGTKLDATYQGRTQYPLLLSEDKASFSFPDCNEMFQMFKNFAGGYFFDADRVPNVVTFASFNKVQDDQRSIYNDNAVFITAFNPERSPTTNPTLSTVNRDYANTTSSAINYITAIYKADNYLYLRKTYDATRDLVIKVDPYSVSEIGDNKPMNYVQAFLVPFGNNNADGLLADGVCIHNCGDDSCPLNYNGTYIGANHGANQVVALTNTTHGKTVADIGSSWIDTAGKTFYLIRVVDANVLWFLSTNIATNGTWSHTTTITTGLTHVANAINTGAIGITSQKIVQYEPAYKNQSKLVYLNGVTPLTDVGIYTCNNIEIRESYDIVDPDDSVAMIVAAIPVGGYTVQPALNQGQAEVTVNNIYRFDRYGFRIKTKYTVSKFIQNNGYMGALQSYMLEKGAYTHRYYYIPDVTSISDTTPTAFDFAAIALFDSLPVSDLTIGAANWVNASYIPSRFIQLLGTAAQLTDVGYAFGYHMNKADSGYINRLEQATNAIVISGNGKSYPRFIDTKYGAFIGLVSFDIDTYRLYFPPKLHSANATCSYLYDAGDGLYLYFDYHTTVANDELVIGTEYNGKTVTVIKKHANTTVDTTTVADGKIIVDIANDYGYGILKLT